MQSAIRLFPETDIAVTGQSSYMKSEVNTSHIQMPLLQTKLTLLSGKVAFRTLLSVWISMISQEMKLVEKSKNVQGLSPE